MLLLSTTLLLAGLHHTLPAVARPVVGASSILSSPDAFNALPEGMTPLPREDMMELGRLALAVNTAYCPLDRELEPHPTQAYGPGTDRRGSTILVSSRDPEYEMLSEEEDMNWYISYTPSTHTVTLALSSLPSTDDFLELLASDPPAASSSSSSARQPHLVDLPEYMFPYDSNPTPRIHHSYLSPLETHGAPAALALLDMLENAPAAPASNANMLRQWLSLFTGPASVLPTESVSAPRIQHIEIVGHGLGASIGLLVALALHLEISGPAATQYAQPLTHVDIRATLFGLPRVGDQAFADWVDELVSAQSNKLQINRVSSYADTIAHLPARHLDLAHPSIGEFWVGADPRVVYACKSEQEGTESQRCSASIPLGRSSLQDHAGPFGGVRIGANSCRRPKVDLANL